MPYVIKIEAYLKMEGQSELFHSKFTLVYIHYHEEHLHCISLLAASLCCAAGFVKNSGSYSQTALTFG